MVMFLLIFLRVRYDVLVKEGLPLLRSYTPQSGRPFSICAYVHAQENLIVITYLHDLYNVDRVSIHMFLSSLVKVQDISPLKF